MTYTDLVKKVAAKIDLKPEEVAILWREASSILMDQLAQHTKIRIKNFGAFVVVKHKSRTVPDPREMTKKLVIFDQHIPKFRPSEQLRALVKDVMPNQSNAAVEQGLEPTSETNDLDSTAGQPTAKEPLAQDQGNQPTDTTPPIMPPLNNPVDPPPAVETAAHGSATPPTKKEPAETDLHTENINIDYIDLGSQTIDKAILGLIPFHLAQKYQMVPVEKHDDKLIIAMIDPGDREAIDLVARQTGLIVEPKITTLSDLQVVLDQYQDEDVAKEIDELADGQEASEDKKEEIERETSNDAPAAKIVTSLLERAVRSKASDIHIEPEEKKVFVRLRIDGILQNIMEIPKKMQLSVTSRLKIISNLKIDESRLPQDGRIRLVVDNSSIDFRLSTLPTVNGEKIVMRILDKSGGILSFEELGLIGENLKRIEESITKAHGMLLVTGPTGSGKTTTLYSVIGRVMNPGINIVTLEDPVEYRIPGINQSQVNSAIGFDFANGLRTIVRQDPDVILIGEIRDGETATMAIHSALTGHVVLSTLHTNDAAGAVPRLIDMGIEAFLITSSTNAVIAQRLVRQICPHCKMKADDIDQSIEEIQEEIAKMPDDQKPKTSELVFYKGKGCRQCNDSGYKGRIGIFEVLILSEEIKQLALKRVSSEEISKQATAQGMITMKQDGILKALAGQTTIEEVWRVTKD